MNTQCTNHSYTYTLCICMYGICTHYTHSHTLKCMSVHSACINEHTYTMHLHGVCMKIHIHMHTCTCAHTHTRMVCACVHCACINKHAYTMHTYTMCMCAWCVHENTHTPTYTMHTHTWCVCVHGVCIGNAHTHAH